jgi:lipopolysaccharide transport system permease protein
MSLVFSTVFRQQLGEYLIYILSGIVVWDLISSSTISGGGCILNSEQYIRQFNHPITIYTLRYALLNTITFAIEINALFFWILISRPFNLIIGLLTLPLTLVLYFLLAWPVTTIAGYLNAKYRDYPQVMALVMQTIWYLSPVFFKKEQFLSNKMLSLFFDLNPITHILSLIREPLLYGKMPSIQNYGYVLLTILIFSFWAYKVNKNNEKKIIFYL